MTFEVVHLTSLERRFKTHTAVAVGNFDGVHRGHQALISAAREEALSMPGQSTLVALTFDPHPARVLSPDRAPAGLMTLDEKASVLASLGVDTMTVLPFTPEVSSWPPEDFARRVLAEALGAEKVVVGRHFRFGRARRGDLALLERLGGELGFGVRGLEPLLHEGTPISSTRIREALARGAVESARALLGRRFAIAGEVVRGDGRGRQIGIPTANLRVDGETTPGRGVYACWCAIDDGAWQPAVVNIGRRPTFAGTNTTVEAHLPGFEGDLYGRSLRLEFEARLREEKAFDGVDALVAQIRADIALGSRLLAHTRS